MRRPMINVSFSNGSNVFKTMALLDSGADVSAISSDIAEIIGLNTDGPRAISRGVAGKVESIEKRVNISFGKDHETYKFTVPVKILFVDESDSPSFVPLLGRAGSSANSRSPSMRPVPSSLLKGTIANRRTVVTNPLSY